MGSSSGWFEMLADGASEVFLMIPDMVPGVRSSAQTIAVFYILYSTVVLTEDSTGSSVHYSDSRHI